MKSGPWRRRRAAGWALLAVLVGAAGCDVAGDPVPAECDRIGVQCQLPNGPLGVCQERPCEPGKAAPCFTCTSQH
jgi:hypothetical protein